jgi:membrane protein YqaA with SNARE-associated domain
VQSVLDTLDGFGGVYLAIFLIAIVSGIFPLVNSEATLIALGARSSYGWPKLVILAIIVAIGQCITHASVYFSARGLAKAGSKKRPKLEARLAKAHALAEKWKKSEVLLIALGATVGIPPQVLVAMVAGIVEIRFRVFCAIDITGRIGRFVFIVLMAHLAHN